MILEPLPLAFAICRLDPSTPIPDWVVKSSFFSVTRTADELSIVCMQMLIPSDVKAERNWRCLKVRGPLDFGLTGVLASLANPLAEAGISIFAISTFDTDYLLVKQSDFDRATTTLVSAGHEVS